jgi:hypothetical protein
MNEMPGLSRRNIQMRNTRNKGSVYNKDKENQ